MSQYFYNTLRFTMINLMHSYRVKVLIKKKNIKKILLTPNSLNRNVDAIKKQIALGIWGIESNCRNLCASESVRSICVCIHVEIRPSDLIPLTGVPSAKQMWRWVCLHANKLYPVSKQLKLY